MAPSVFPDHGTIPAIIPLKRTQKRIRRSNFLQLPARLFLTRQPERLIASTSILRHPNEFTMIHKTPDHIFIYFTPSHLESWVRWRSG